MQPAGAGERLDTREVNVVPAFAPEAGLEKFVAPFGVTKRWALTGNRRVEKGRRGVAKIGERLLRFIRSARDHDVFLDVLKRPDGGGGNGLDRERSGDTYAGLVQRWLIIKCVLLRGLIVGYRAKG